MREGEVALSFRVGNRYYDSTKNRVFECVAIKGKKARLVAFSMLDCVDWVKREIAKYGDWEFNKVRIVDGVETCCRGAIRADRYATDKEINHELEFIKELRKPYT